MAFSLQRTSTSALLRRKSPSITIAQFDFAHPTPRRKRAVPIFYLTTVRHASTSSPSQRRQHSSTTSVPPPQLSGFSQPQVPSQEPPSPLAPIPTRTLLRSLLIATVSSYRWLLSPSLSVLSYLSRPGHSFLLNVDRNPLLHGLLKRTFYDQFCAGENDKDAKACVKYFKDLGFRGMILTYAKESVHDPHGKKTLDSGKSGQVVEVHDAEIEVWKKVTMNTAYCVEENDMLAIKFTGAGPAVTSALSAGVPLPKQMLDALHEICSTCVARGIRVIVDAESQLHQTGIAQVTLDLMRAYNTAGHAVVYNTYQAYLKETTGVVAIHLEAAEKEGFTLGLKLVRGAYILSDERKMIHDTKQDTDDAYNAIALGAVQRKFGIFGSEDRPFPSVNLFLASHNKDSVLDAHRMHQQRVQDGLPTVPIAYAQLQGMSDEVSFALLAEKGAGSGPEVYKCSTWGSMSECLAYLTRRAVENRDAVGRTKDEMAALKTEAWRRLGTWFGGSQTAR